MSSTVQFFKAAIKAPLQISTLFQTSSSTVKRLLSPLYSDPHCSLLELGVGAGAVTDKAYETMKHREKYLGFEINNDLFSFVIKKFQGFQFICASAEAISQYTQGKKYDLIVSTLPWSLFDDFTRKGILDEIAKHLEKGGYFKTYMVCNAFITPAGRKFRAQLNDRFDVSSRWVLLNIPPAKVFECRARMEKPSKKG